MLHGRHDPGKQPGTVTNKSSSVNGADAPNGLCDHVEATRGSFGTLIWPAEMRPDQNFAGCDRGHILDHPLVSTLA
jgi:hypothetical protein